MRYFFGNGKQNRTGTLRYTLTGLASGFFNGLLGSGGGILIVFALSSAKGDGRGGGRDAFANALAVMLPVSVVSTVLYMLSGRVEASVPVYLIPAAVGGVVGALLLDVLKLPFLKKLFALVVVWSGVYMVMR